ncbi:phage minor tail protein L [Acinetobacter pollinis]|uniref:phage minor tail protein L n=1 Tax=Acinetobacter pollinis TaxID=2605270 RepID=UPI0018C2D915|nr:phage minor tail protein L [Acinetobacter pollinis]MBF7694224.1 phage minor tail protein L [Acinetobacter pollinis]MBF7701795.1 phage minor tail protein L [Acinetobacter pollinis]
MSLTSDVQKLYVDGLITLFELDATNLGAGVLRFHGHIAFEDWKKIYITADNTNITTDSTLIHADKLFDVGGEQVWYRNIIFDGQTYEPMALQVDGLEMSSTGKASTPTLTMANSINGVQGAVSAYCLNFDDFAGAKLKVIRTFAKYLDSENFSQGNPHANVNESKTQVWYIEQKTSENIQTVVFELSNPIDFQGLKIPVRNITGYCQWAIDGYRGEQCQYTGMKYFTDKNEPTDDPSQDKCRGDFRACKSRYNESNYGGFPASSLIGK